MLKPTDSLEMSQLSSRYRDGDLTPTEVIEGILQRIATRGEDHTWISVFAAEELLARARALQQQGPQSYPLYGIPFAIKDNIDIADFPTTAACPAFAYIPTTSAPVVTQLQQAGAIAIGKTNMDQFATGLVGTRSPYGAVHNPFNPAYIAGGSSSGSAVAVAAGLVSFALGTDTAGSGRVPAAFNNIVGLKPTRGMLSTRGVVPACRSLDCVSIFALCAQNARAVLTVAKGFDPHDPFSRPAGDSCLPHDAPRLQSLRFGVPRTSQRVFCGDASASQLFDQSIQRLQAIGGEIEEIDVTPFSETARLLYEGPWVAERYVAIRSLLDQHPEALHPVTRDIIKAGATPSAADAFAAYYRLKALRRMTSTVWEGVDFLVTPTAPTIFTIAQVESDPLRLNTQLGTYTNFMNLLDLSGIAVPAGFLRNGLPFGITLTAPAYAEAALCSVGDSVHRAAGLCMGATSHALPPVRVCVTN